MRRRKRFTIKLVALGLANMALAAPTALAVPDEGLNGLQPIQVVSLKTADDVERPTPVSSPPLVTADDVAHPSLVESQPVVSTDDGFEFTTLGITGIVLLLGGGAAFMAMYQVRKANLANA